MEPTAGNTPHEKIEDVIKSLNLKGSIAPQETPAERKTRLAQQEADSAHQRRKDWWLFVIASTLTCVTAAVCLIASFVPGLNSEDRRWANSVVMTVIGAAITYWAGNKVK